MKTWLRALVALIVWIGGVAAPARAERAGQTPQPVYFEVWRNGSLIGTHRIAFRHDGADLVVDIDIRLAVSFASITLFRYEHRNEERWRDGRLIAMTSATNDDGTAERVDIAAGADGLVVRGSDFAGTVPADLLPTTYWRMDSVRQRRLISSQDGRPMAVTVTDAGLDTVQSEGRAVPASRYLMRGDLDLDLWYDAAGNWVKLEFAASDGSVIEYRRVVEPRRLEAEVRP
ncbi:DUF6134 family protein [Zavarzinia aquatilis]|uniref:DUF3108 domain-containing protein n=1 Tax=Zavarzinia aquatilis TaxID=2211142 RepID=A0A317DV54_9PROT|nr:DUF6134 family protein [Zavarzinia aquatilis]PWR18559.1 hypothetical protein DKG74_18190 [Zavarzinia aquatilis]